MSPPLSRFKILALVCITVLVAVIYSNTLHSSWQFDDIPNILQNKALHLRSLDLDSLRRAAFASPTGSQSIHRSLARLSLALNWYFGQDNVTGYHLVNIFIHICTAFLLFLVVLKLYDSPRLRTGKTAASYYTALLTAVLWAASPVNVQAVTYIVQRMASLAALFYVWGILNYIRARMEKQRLRQYVAFSLTLVCFVAAVMSKENAITFPVAILLIELIFFQNSKTGLWQTGKYLLPLCLLSILLIFSIMPINVSTLLDYSNRSFSLQNRLLTEPRIVVYYLSLLFYPVPARLSLLHDIQISTSLFHPFTTILAIGFLAVLCGYSLLTYKKNPIFSFAVLFFLLNHLVESTVLPLELIFEYRNYLPALFLFWPLSVIFVRGITYYRTKRPSISVLVAVLLAACIISSGRWTYQTNGVWKTEFSLWFDVMKKYPDLARPYQLMGILFTRTGKDKLAEKYYLLSLTKKTQTPGRDRHLVYNNLGSIYLKKGQYDKAQQCFQRALDAMPGDAKSYLNLIRTLIKKSDYGEAERLTDLAMKMKTHRKDAEFLNLKGFILLKTGRSGEAIPYLRAARFVAPGAVNVYLNLAAALVKSGKYVRAQWLLTKATEKFGVKIRFLLLQVENEVRHKKRQAADALARKIFTLYDLTTIQHALIEKPDGIAPDPELVRPVLNRVYEQQVKKMSAPI